MGDYGTAEFRAHYGDDGKVERVEVVHADPVIGISLELLAQSTGSRQGLWVDADGMLWLAGDPRYRYRPVRFECLVDGLQPGQAVEGTRVLICERMGD